jgi:hypothetical protein
MINMLQVVSYFIDNKVFKLETGNSLRFRLIRFLSWLYRPMALLRLRHGLSAFLIEDLFFRWAASLYRL